jgi:hypothetical protein
MHPAKTQEPDKTPRASFRLIFSPSSDRSASASIAHLAAHSVEMSLSRGGNHFSPE